jgi:outer membrane protein assembly factor BamB
MRVSRSHVLRSLEKKEIIVNDSSKSFLRSYAMVATLILVVACSSGCGTLSSQSEWSQWRGPNRDGKSADVDLLKVWPEEGPTLLWGVKGFGKGYSSLSIANGRIYTTGMSEDGGEGVLFAHDFNGNLEWQSRYGSDWQGSYPGARSTPTVDGDRVYVMSGTGTIACFDSRSGERKWAVDTVETFGGKSPKFGYSESVLIDGEKVICSPGGEDATLVALNKFTGETVWTTKGFSDLSAYCSPILVENDSGQWIVTMTERSIAGINARTGAVAWKVPHQAMEGIHPNTPIYHDGAVYATSGYGTGGELVRPSADWSSATQVWADTTLDCHHGGVVFLDGYIYGTDSGGIWHCLEWTNGETAIKERVIGKGSLTHADGMFYLYAENGTVGLVQPSPTGSTVVSTFNITEGTGEHWAHPVVADGRLYIRHGDALMAFDVEGTGAAQGAIVAIEAIPQTTEDGIELPPNVNALIARGSNWSYSDGDVSPGTNWMEDGYDDSSWSSGPALLGYGDDDIVTTIDFGPDPNNKRITSFYRHPFVMTNRLGMLAAELRLLRDDGAIVYLNGAEVYRSNMPTGTVSFGTTSSGSGSGGEHSFFKSRFNPELLVEGANLVAVEVHQHNLTTSDSRFDFELVTWEGETPNSEE